MPHSSKPIVNLPLDLIKQALTEDLGKGDVTTAALVPELAVAEAGIVARATGVIAGAGIAAAVFRQLDEEVTIKIISEDGARVNAGDAIMTMRGRARALLSGERTALNFLQRLSGIATQTAAYKVRMAPHPVALLDTRKTTPGWRALEKYAVQCGGGTNHRMGLYDRVMIKDNHLAFWSSQSERTIQDAIKIARKRFPELLVQVEIDHPDQLDAVLAEPPDWVLLDNMSADQVRACVARCADLCRTEVSGGISLETVGDYAAAGPDAISVGALTHSVRAMDCSMDWLH